MSWRCSVAKKNLTILKNHDVLGIAHAAVGDFTEAASAARRALQLANQQGRTDLAIRIARRLEAYQAGRQP